jgi:methylated-DNA-[protein]-cysteine S-methyltransferase
MNTACIETPAGPLLLAEQDGAITRVGFRGAGSPPPSGGLLAEAAAQLHAYFAGELTEFDLPLAPHGTVFQLAVWHELAAIPYGTTTSYGAIARAIGRPDRARAVGAANGANPIAIVLPCHRVIGSDGSLTGYGGGLPLKRMLLDLEAGRLALLG